MKKSIYQIYSEEIEKLKNDANTNAIYLVGSSKDIDLESKNISIGDIDIFVFVKNGDLQTRIVKEIENIGFDINYFSEKGVHKFINDKEYFFLKEMKNPKVVYDKNNTSNQIINLCKEKFIEGPNKISEEEIKLLKACILAKLDDLKDIEKFNSLKEEDVRSYKLCKKAIETYEYKDLINAYKYIFKEQL